MSDQIEQDKIDENYLLNEIYNISNAELKKITKYLDDLDLTDRQRKFSYFYVNNDFKGADAARKAGCKHSSKKTTEAAAMACQASLLKSITKVKEAINRIIDNQLRDFNEIRKRLNDYWWKRASYDIATFIDDDGEFKALKQIPKAWRCCVDGVEKKYYGKDAHVKVVVAKLADRDKAMEKLDRLINMTGNKEDDSNKLTDETMKNLMNKLKGE